MKDNHNLHNIYYTHLRDLVSITGDWHDAFTSPSVLLPLGPLDCLKRNEEKGEAGCITETRKLEADDFLPSL